MRNAHRVYYAKNNIALPRDLRTALANRGCKIRGAAAFKASLICSLYGSGKIYENRAITIDDSATI